ncbi:gp006R [Rabbit fibroma virus]|uniref:Gp006L n=1 Tax=Rabbit fibroma virus (strain Kasza) TaxID=10272 RepID=Q9PX31_RFVKA|nr:gp006L [Rabbit fibroma virus]NP_052043.1 gp006R [Rabbit fibroma virus]AAF17889.1 gp006L [Rabbit fibroma virus]AAF18036.1 gp006R [Rabbit fibroma virus]
MNRSLLSFLENGTMSDVTIIAGTSKFTAHRLILSVHSDYFYRLFNGGFEVPDTVTLDTDDVVLREVLTYMYTGCSNVRGSTVENIQSVIILADYLGIHKLVKECIDYIVTQVEPSNCIAIFQFADTYHIEDLKRILHMFFPEILLSSREAFAKLDTHEALIVLRESHKIVGRRFVIKSILDWVRKEPKHIKQIKALSEAIGDDVEKDTIYEVYSRYMEEIKDTPHTPPLSHNCIITIDRRRYIRAYSPDMMWNTRIAHVGRVDIGDRFTVVCMDNVLYCLGGTLNGVPTSDVLGYDLLTGDCTYMPDMRQHRRNASACSVNGCIYAIGGIDEEGRLIPNVEYWTPSNDDWYYSRYLYPNVEAATVCYKNELWVAGGTIDLYPTTFTNAVNRLTDDGWVKMAPLPMPRSGASMVVYKGRLYCLGGRTNEHSDTNHVYRYDDVCCVWERIEDMTEARRNPICCVYNNTLYVLGGRTNSAESYNGWKWHRVNDVSLYTGCTNTAYPFFIQR